MKLQKLAQRVKASGTCKLCRVQMDEVWIYTAYAVYRCFGLPPIFGRDQMATIFGLSAKQAGKIAFDERDAVSATAGFGIDLSDMAEGEMETTRLGAAALVAGVETVRCKDGEILFFDHAALRPLEDVICGSDYITINARRAPDGRYYLVVKDGLTLLAAIEPMQVVNEAYITKLTEYLAACAEQQARQLERNEVAHDPD